MIDSTRSGDPRLIQTFAIRLGSTPESKDVGLAAGALWVGISATLEPIFGAGGVSALFARSVFLTAKLFPTLEAVPDVMNLSNQLDAFRSFLSTLDGAGAAEVAQALMREFHGVLISMVGTALANQLLEPILDQALSEKRPLNALR
ncbi:MAG: hypothetical protein H7099_05830 [Gemmatimonadaceae bacterium]|nr:hypothetical protein [Gemmatimonadaceae bacterium]